MDKEGLWDNLDKMASKVQWGWKVKEVTRANMDHQGIPVIQGMVEEMGIQVSFPGRDRHGSFIWCLGRELIQLKNIKILWHLPSCH